MDNFDSTNHSEISSKKLYTVEVRCQADSGTLGFLDHYFLVIGNLEYHLGLFVKGSVIPINSTKGSHVVCEKTVCEECYKKIMEFYETKEDKRLFNFYPFINCETFSTGLSFQAMSMIFAPFIAGLLLFCKFLYAILLGLIATITFLGQSKYNFSRTHKFSCRHITQRGNQ
ncbi:Ac81-1 [Venturia canescens]|uniref:Ac81-1 n=2 Tax=Venturia canescens TaxID=32260 RepID=A0ACB9ZHM9_9HYME|nr:uncharacterized LOC122409420 [Venturia canescens]AJZ73103.1 Ac81-like.1 [Venturia canescens]KAI5630641.1 Ac81-1 [Venturia canescens]